MFGHHLPSIIIDFVDLRVRRFDEGDIFRIPVPIAIVPPVVAIEYKLLVNECDALAAATNTPIL